MISDILFSILLGIIMSFLLLIYVYNTYYIKIKGPNSKNIVNKVYKYNGRCYRFVPEIYICPIN